MAPRFIARQLSHPSGIIGRIVMAVMNRANAAMNAFARTALEVGLQDTFLDIGFGGGLSIPPFLARAAKVVGVDRSHEAVAAAALRHAADVAAGRAAFLTGTVEALPLPAAAIDKVLSVNTVYFWSSLNTGMAEIKRVMRPGGRIAIGFWPKEYMVRMKLPSDVFTMRTEGEILAALDAAGFHAARIARPRRGHWLVALAES